MRVEVVWDGGMRQLGSTGSGHQVMMDGPPDLGGGNAGPRPMEMLLLGLGACASVDVVHILTKMRQPISDCRVRIEAERASSDPKVFTRIELCFMVTGQRLKAAQVERAVALSAEKYCSASAMLAKAATLTHRVEIIEQGDNTSESSPKTL